MGDLPATVLENCYSFYTCKYYYYKILVVKEYILINMSNGYWSENKNIIFNKLL